MYLVLRFQNLNQNVGVPSNATSNSDSAHAVPSFRDKLMDKVSQIKNVAIDVN